MSFVRPRRAAYVAALLLPLVAGSLGAQTLPVRDSLVAPDSLVIARDLGAAAGDRRAAGSYFFGGFLLGVPTGFAAPIAVANAGYSGGNVAKSVTLGGVVAVAVFATEAGRRAASPEPAEAATLASDAPALREAFDAAFAERVQAKRRRRAVQGAATGAVTGLAILGGGLLLFIASLGG